MVSQLRIYTINRGMMESWLKLFREKIVPLHEKYGIPVENAWVNKDGTEFIWVRNFSSLESLPAQEARYYSSPERLAMGDAAINHIARMEVRVVESVGF